MGYFKYVNAAYTSPGGSATDGAKLFDLTTGMLCLSMKGGLMMDEVRRGGVEDELYDAMFADSGEAQFIPFGFGNHVGITELANPKYQKTYPKLHADAVQAMRGFNALVQRLEGLCYDNLFMRSRAAPFFYKQKTVAAAVFANLIHERVPSLMVKGRFSTPDEPFGTSSIEGYFEKSQGFPRNADRLGPFSCNAIRVRFRNPVQPLQNASQS
jgi:hypothetical protein